MDELNPRRSSKGPDVQGASKLWDMKHQKANKP